MGRDMAMNGVRPSQKLRQVRLRINRLGDLHTVKEKSAMDDVNA